LARKRLRGFGPVLVLAVAIFGIPILLSELREGPSPAETLTADARQVADRYVTAAYLSDGCGQVAGYAFDPDAAVVTACGDVRRSLELRLLRDGRIERSCDAPSSLVPGGEEYAGADCVRYDLIGRPWDTAEDFDIATLRVWLTEDSDRWAVVGAVYEKTGGCIETCRREQALWEDAVTSQPGLGG
jgi:hypothetical protein